MRILLFSGFLGSGKTSTILQVAKYITESRQETVAIIENEIGAAGIDDKLLTDSGLVVKSLFGGCVCCQITSDLISAIREIQEKINPDWLIIEMTGLAIPGNVVKLINQYCAFHTGLKTIAIVDGGRWLELKEMLEPLVVGQVQESNLVILNKADLAGVDVQVIYDDLVATVEQIAIIITSAVAKLPLAVLEEVIDFEGCHSL